MVSPGGSPEHLFEQAARGSGLGPPLVQPYRPARPLHGAESAESLLHRSASAPADESIAPASVSSVVAAGDAAHGNSSDERHVFTREFAAQASMDWSVRSCPAAPAP